MAQMIEMFENDYLKNSIQQTIDIIQKKNDIKQVKTLEKKINEIYNNGCLYKEHYEGKPEIRTFLEIFTIPKYVTPIDIVTIFFPLCFIENTKTDQISRPVILEQKHQRGGGVQMLSEDNRRHIYALNIRELGYIKDFNYGRFVIKIALNKDYSRAYDVEGKVYGGMKNCKNVVKMYRADKFNNENKNIFWIQNTQGLIINMKKLLMIESNINDIFITLPNANIYTNMSFLVLENCYNHQTLSNYVRREREDNNDTRSYEAFKKTMKAVQELNTKVGFFHGDLHTDNVLIRENGEDIKLFDFDFSALLGKQIISNNLLFYNLTWKPCAYVNEDCTLFIEENNVVKVQPKIDKTEFNINNFMFIFDYFRLLFSILKKRRISDKIISDYPEFENISRKILVWYTNLDKKKEEKKNWNYHFEGNVFLPIYYFIRCDEKLLQEKFIPDVLIPNELKRPSLPNNSDHLSPYNKKRKQNNSDHSSSDELKKLLKQLEYDLDNPSSNYKQDVSPRNIVQNNSDHSSSDELKKLLKQLEYDLDNPSSNNKQDVSPRNIVQNNSDHSSSDELKQLVKQLEYDLDNPNSNKDEFKGRLKQLEQVVLPKNNSDDMSLSYRSLDKNKHELKQLFTELDDLDLSLDFNQGNFVRNDPISNDGSLKGGGNKLKKYTRLGRGQIKKDNKRTNRVIYKSGKGYYIRDVKGIYTLVKKNDVIFA
jgi:serine/threonine protein kinase